MTTTFLPPHIGGIEYHVLNLSKHLANRGHKITILTSLLPEMPLEAREILHGGIEIVRTKTYFFPGWPYQSLSSVGITVNAENTVKELIKEKSIDIIHAHGHHYPLTWSAINIAHKLNLPSVLTLHGMYALNPTKLPARAIEEIFNLTVFKRVLEKATVVLGLTQTINEYAKKYNSKKGKCYIIPNGVDIRKFSEAKSHKRAYRQKHQIPENKVVFLFRGRFTSAKGILELAEAASLFVERYKETFFLFVGGGPLYERLKQTVKSVRSSSKIVGWVPDSEIHELYIASDVYVLPSRWEALPITVIEAMASCLHIVATPVGGIPDVLASYPWKTYIEGLSSTRIIEALRRALISVSTEGEADLGMVADYVKSFDWSYIAEETEKVYINIRKDLSKRRFVLRAIRHAEINP